MLQADPGGEVRGTARSESDEMAPSNLIDQPGVAIGGFDVVSYLERGVAEPGGPEHSATHKGVRFQFSNDEHRRLFLADPSKYRPAYGGWCATAMARGDRVESDPRSFTIRDGRVFLFYRFAFVDARDAWLKDPAAYTAAADHNWAVLGRRAIQADEAGETR